VIFYFLFAANTGYSQNASGNPRYYDNLMDSLFWDVQNVANLGMDYALNKEKRIEGDFIDWVTGRDMKNPEQEDYYQAVHTLHEGWDLLLQGGIYNEMRRRQTDDAVTRQLGEQAEQLRLQGAAKVKKANILRKAADNKRNARLLAEREKADQQKAAIQERNINDVKSLSEEFGKLNEEEEIENDRYNNQLGIASSERNPKKRQILVSAESARHEKRMNELNRRRDELGKKMNLLISEQTKSGEVPTIGGKVPQSFNIVILDL